MTQLRTQSQVSVPQTGLWPAIGQSIGRQFPRDLELIHLEWGSCVIVEVEF